VTEDDWKLEKEIEWDIGWQGVRENEVKGGGRGGLVGGGGGWGNNIPHSTHGKSSRRPVSMCKMSEDGDNVLASIVIEKFKSVVR
jgi:hypothetical protein